MFTPLNCRGGCYFFLDKKVTKKSSRQKCFFALQAFHAQIPKTCGAGIFLPGYPFKRRPCNAKTSYALPGAQACRFLGFRPKLICRRGYPFIKFSMARGLPEKCSQL